MNFKKIKYTIILGLLIGITNSCDKDVLDQVDPNRLSPETFLESPSQVQSAVNAIYANLQTRGLFSRHMFFAMDNMGHDNDHTNNPQLEADKLQYLRFTFDATHGPIRAFWESCYHGINKANFLLNSQEKLEAAVEEFEDFTEADKNRANGEAQFLRGYYYFLIASRFGDAPLITVIPPDGGGFEKSPQSAIYDQIESDLTAAANNLPAPGDTEPGRASRGAALALLGKVHLYQQEYAEAKAAFDQVYGQYTLAANFYDNFMEETEHNSEIIWGVEYANLGNSAQWNSDFNGIGLNETTFRGQEYGFNDWFNVYPSGDLVAEFETGDPRRAQTFYFNGDTFAGGTVSLPAYDDTPDDGIDNPVQRQQAWRKYQNYYRRANEELASTINFQVIRYADVLLMMAEVYNETDPSGAATIGYLNEVRDRAGMPHYGTTEMNDAGYPVTTKEERFAAIMHERRVELAGEQSRFPDLVRWGLADDELSQFGFKPNKHEFFPIPQQEINTNEALTNEDQNPGY
ncbi:RagB/SusD family nutrient uptake outer membrane protein [Fulvivirga lutimaris]|uniref:RagB/SusD family nutrient uptake outer membrane protein n=1 Tax=Fulvivirga lutimaris TaxID=1819566 RepID=UPI0012BBAE6A|nr:RagB/SusD family nutrient uptake outer membrane protein [Fulvivirga lutimaris]MTI39256.1 RagB/SusD family nutrient uptake outer membrane protein [Fulvivirga lutimaris]